MEDDEEDAPREPPRETHPASRQARHPNPIETQQENMRQILLSRSKPKVKPRKPSAPKWIDPKQLRVIEQKARVLDDPYHLADVFLTLKHAHLEDHILNCQKITMQFQRAYNDIFCIIYERLKTDVLRGAVINSTLEHQYCQAVYHQLPMLSREVTHRGLEISGWRRQVTQLRHDILNRTLQGSAALICKIETFISKAFAFLDAEIIQPRDSARAKIDGLLAYTPNLHKQYAMLQAKGNAVLQGHNAIERQLSFLGSSFGQNAEEWFKTFTETWSYHKRQISFALHMHRNKWLREQQRGSPLAAARLWSMSDLSELMSQGRAQSNNAKWMLEAIMLPSKEPRRALIRDEKRSLARYLKKLYFDQWKISKHQSARQKTRSPFKNRHWRQLDVMAPFQTFLMYDWRLQCEVNYLLRTLGGAFGPMWANMTDEESKRHQSNITLWTKTQFERRKQLIGEIELLTEMNWVRLEIEEKLHGLGEPNDTRGRELFVPVLELSRSRRDFQVWSKKLGAIAGDGWLVNKLLSFSEVSDTSMASFAQKFFPILTEMRHAEKRQISKRSEASTGKPSTRTPETTGESHEPKSTRTIIKVRARHLRSALGARKWLVKHPENTATDQPGSVSTQQSSSIPESSAQHVGPGSRAICQSGLKLSLDPESPNPALSAGPSVARLIAQKSSDESLQAKSQTSGAPPIESSPKGSVNTGAGDATSLDQPVSHEREITTTGATAPLFWSHKTQLGPTGRKVNVHYCGSLQKTEQVVRLFHGSKVIGFDMEWKAQAPATDPIRNNLSMIQIANEEHIALVHIALFKPARFLADFVPPSLKRLLESPDVTKVGVSIKADATRLRRYLGIETRSIFELSYLFKVLKYGQTSPKLVNKRAVNLSDQIEEHLGLPLEKSDDVRCGDWTRALNPRQVQCKSTQLLECILGPCVLTQCLHRRRY